MTTLLIVRNKEGEILRKCDKLCYDGTGRHCDCICDGVNHGVGLERALKNSARFHHAALIPYLPHDHRRQEYLEVVSTPAKQMSLFTLCEEHGIVPAKKPSY